MKGFKRKQIRAQARDLQIESKNKVAIIDIHHNS